jgi:hypothetical protein
MAAVTMHLLLEAPVARSLSLPARPALEGKSTSAAVCTPPASRSEAPRATRPAPLTPRNILGKLQQDVCIFALDNWETVKGQQRAVTHVRGRGRGELCRQILLTVNVEDSLAHSNM